MFSPEPITETRGIRYVIGQRLDDMLYLDSTPPTPYGLRVGKAQVPAGNPEILLCEGRRYAGLGEIQMVTITRMHEDLHCVLTYFPTLSSAVFPFALCDPATLILESDSITDPPRPPKLRVLQQLFSISHQSVGHLGGSAALSWVWLMQSLLILHLWSDLQRDSWLKNLGWDDTALLHVASHSVACWLRFVFLVDL